MGTVWASSAMDSSDTDFFGDELSAPARVQKQEQDLAVSKIESPRVAGGGGVGWVGSGSVVGWSVGGSGGRWGRGSGGEVDG